MFNKYHIITYGCQMNYSDTERLESYLNSLGLIHSPDFKKADLIIYNTCSIRQKAEDRLFGEMEKVITLRKKNKNLIVGLTGCMSRISSSRNSDVKDKLFNKSSELDVVFKIDDLLKLKDLLLEINPHLKFDNNVSDNLENFFQVIPTYNKTPKNFAFLTISTGCDKFCSYCIVPYSRGREKSRPVQDILDEAKGLVEKGFKEIWLLGQSVNSYGVSVLDKLSGIFKNIPGKKEPFSFLLEELDKLKSKGLQRIRFSSPHPNFMTDQLIETMSKLQTLQPYLHLPIQSGDDAVLKRMNRPYTTAQYKEIIKKLKTAIPDIVVTTDIIVGFCGETEEEFINTYNFFREMAFDLAYIAQYSERKGTASAKKMKDDIPEEIKKSRWNKLNDLLREISREKLQNYVGKTYKVFVEKYEKGNLFGRSEHYKEVLIPSKKDLTGEIIPVKITASTAWALRGELIKE